MRIYNSQFTIYKKIICSLMFIVPCLLLPSSVARAYTVEVSVDTGRESVNALEGEVILPQGTEVSDMALGDSAILMWIKEPEVMEGRIQFAGITPGGFVGKYPLFYIDIVDDLDVGTIGFGSVSAIRSDGSGDTVPVRLSATRRELSTDTEMPEPFAPVVSSSPDILDGRKFVAFLAQDNGAGIEYYEVASTWLMSPDVADWSREISPKVLTRAELFKKIYVKAIDGAGNYRVEVIHGPYWYATLAFGLIIFVCVLLFLNRSFFSRR